MRAEPGQQPTAEDGESADVPVDSQLAASDGAGGVARGAVLLAMKALLVKGSQTIVLIVLAAILMPQALGVLAIGTLVMNVSLSMTNVGTASALVYWRGDVRTAARTAVSISLALGLAMTALLWVAAPWLSHTLHADPDGTEVVRGLALVIPLTSLSQVGWELLRRDLRWVRRVLPEILGAFVGLAVSLTLALTGYGVMSLVIGQVAQAAVGLLLVCLVQPPVVPGWTRAEARELLRYGLPLAGANVLELVQLNVDYLIVAHFLDAAALGQYSLAFRLAYLPFLNVAVVIAGAAFPYLCRLRGREVGQASLRMGSAMLLMVTPLCLGLALLSSDITLLGDKWQPAVPVVAWLATFALLLSVVEMAETTLQAVGKTSLAMLIRLTHLVVLVVTLLVVVSHGIVAVAIAQLVVGAAMLLFAVLLLQRTVPGFRPLGLLAGAWVPLAGAVAMTAVAFLLRPVLPTPGSSTAGFVVAGFALMAAYAGTVVVLGRSRVTDGLSLIRRRA